MASVMGDKKKPIKCDLCDKEATVHLTQIINGKMHKINLCADCAQEKGISDPKGISIEDILSGQFEQALASNLFQTGQVSCKNCGCTTQDFNNKGLLGCPQCYTEFHDLLIPLLKTVQKGVSHVGKVPKCSLNRKQLKTKLKELEKQLQLAVKEERYEDAARLRDQIQSFTKSIKD